MSMSSDLHDQFDHPFTTLFFKIILQFYSFESFLIQSTYLRFPFSIISTGILASIFLKWLINEVIELLILVNNNF